ncbi:hypothetical protein SAMN05192568_1005220 [Methylobacterium pseudosasicola]|uniref:Uncharacterized protein n=1 Tax=Methylobacterium pseudosasicola TaxID=582667 RepID=A0A1I4I2N6_9HYPH|nr:hypothetical protein SAMN05192568_1005220 [Methylobacterium pseudosasicola]
MIRKLLTIFVLPKLIAYVGRRFAGRSAAPSRRPR